MIITDNILSIARRIARQTDGYPDRRITHPTRDWYIGLFCATVLFLGSCFYAWYLFSSTLSTEEYEVTIDTVKYEQKLVAQVLADYRARQARYESLREDTATLPKSAENTHTDQAKVVPKGGIAPKGTVPPVVKNALIKAE